VLNQSNGCRKKVKASREERSVVVLFRVKILRMKRQCFEDLFADSKVVPDRPRRGEQEAVRASRDLQPPLGRPPDLLE